jgi:peptidyl-prolyl cis-trans isomerase D
MIVLVKFADFKNGRIMAMMNTLREKMGKIVLIAIAFAMFAFIAGDFFGPNSFLFGQDNNVGEIAGKDITYEIYQNAIEEAKTNYTLQYQRQVTETEMPSIRQQAWDRMIAEVAFTSEMDKVGVQVSADEVWDMVQGENIDPTVQQSFVNPETGQFDRERLIQFLQNIDNLAPQVQVQWQLFEKNLQPGRRRLKYDNLMLASNYVTGAEAAQEYANQNNVAEVEYLYIPYYSVSDSATAVTDAMLSTYLNDHKEEYKIERTRTLDYISFSVLPSAEDSTFYREELNEIKEEFNTVADDSVFARVNSDLSTFFGTYNIGNLPAQLQGNASNLTVGDVRGAYLENNFYKIYKVSAILEDTVGTTRANHILFKWADDSDAAKAEARTSANNVLRQIMNGADFGEMAKEHGTDGTASKGGDLGWFTEGRKMVAEFDEAVFAARGKGLIRRLVETQFGYHIIELTEDISYANYKVAMIAREIVASDATRDQAFRKADYFKSTTANYDEFIANALTEGITVASSGKLGANDRRIGSLGTARQIVQWAFRDASVGSVSEVWDLDNDYVIAVMTEEEDEGYADLNSVKLQIRNKVVAEAQAEIIKAKLKDMSGSLEELAAAYGSDANVYNSSDLKISTTSLPSVGFAPEAIGAAFGLADGATSAPIALDNGVIIITLVNKTEAPEVGDYSIFANQLKQKVRGRIAYNINEAIREEANIQDERYKFY